MAHQPDAASAKKTLKGLAYAGGIGGHAWVCFYCLPVTGLLHSAPLLTSPAVHMIISFGRCVCAAVHVQPWGH